MSQLVDKFSGDEHRAVANELPEAHDSSAVCNCILTCSNGAVVVESHTGGACPNGLGNG